MTVRPAFIYVMLRMDGIRKVGRTVNLNSRRYQHVKESGLQHDLEHAWGMSERSTMLVEPIAHRMLREWRFVDGMARELYAAPLNVIKPIVEKAKRQVQKSCPINLMAYDWDGERGEPIVMADGEPLSALDPASLLDRVLDVGEFGIAGLTYENGCFVYRDHAGVGDGRTVPRRKIEKLIRNLSRSM
jgi:hypothetical protein